MIVVFKNFFRNRFVNLTAKSVKYFYPDSKIYCFCLYKHDPSEYETQEKLDLPSENVFYRQTKYHSIGPSVGNPSNNLFFSEGYNLIFEHFKNYDEKILMLAEDHFFTNGSTLRELYENEFDFGYAQWANDNVNGSLLCIRPQRLHNLFPIPELNTSVEHVLQDNFVKRIPEAKRYKVSTRKEEDYCGDGFYTNDANKIEQALKLAKIIG